MKHATPKLDVDSMFAPVLFVAMSTAKEEKQNPAHNTGHTTNDTIHEYEDATTTSDLDHTPSNERCSGSHDENVHRTGRGVFGPDLSAYRPETRH